MPKRRRVRDNVRRAADSKVGRAAQGAVVEVVVDWFRDMPERIRLRRERKRRQQQLREERRASRARARHVPEEDTR